MSETSREIHAVKNTATDSPWFWVMLFSAIGVLFLVAMSPRYAQRQGRLELQYQAHQEKARRQVEGEVAAREQGDEGAATPPAVGELIIPLWPLVAFLTLTFAVSAALFRRERRTVRGNTANGPVARERP